MTSNNFLVVSLVSSIYSIMSSAVTILIIPFQFEVLLFHFLVWVLWLGFPILCWIKVEIMGIFILFLILEEMISAFHHKYDVNWELAIYGLYYVVEVCSLYTHFAESFCHKWMLNFAKSLFCIYWDHFMTFILLFVNMVYRIYWFVNIEQSLQPWDKSHLIMVYDLFNALLNLVC